VLLIVLSVVILLVGLLSEQISSLAHGRAGAAMKRRRDHPTYNERGEPPPLIGGAAASRTASACSIVDDQFRRTATGAVAHELVRTLGRGRKNVEAAILHRTDPANGFGPLYVDGIRQAAFARATI